MAETAILSPPTLYLADVNSHNEFVGSVSNFPAHAQPNQKKGNSECRFGSECSEARRSPEFAADAAASTVSIV
jgi:hypothetical protein